MLDFYSRCKAVAEANGLALRVLLLIDGSAVKLHRVHGELLCDPDTGDSLTSTAHARS